MDKYASAVQTLNHNINTIFSNLSNPSKYRQLLEDNADKLPNEAKQNIDKIKFCADHIEIESPMGAVSLGLDPNDTVSPTRITYAALNSPVKFGLSINLQEIDENTTSAVATLEVDLPFMVRKMVGSQLNAAANKFGELLTILPYE